MQKPLFIILLLCISAQFVFSQNAKNHVWIETPSDTNNPARYTDDNAIYRAGNSYVFEFQYFDKNGNERFMRYKLVPYIKPEILDNDDTSRTTYWLPDFEFVDAFDNDSCINRYRVTVLPYNNNGGFEKDYNQTVEEISYRLNGEYKTLEYSGIVENTHNIWLHPARNLLFQILELAPFPYIQFPIQRNKKWNWELTIGSHWADERWMMWEGSIKNHYRYKITEVGRIIDTPLGELYCTVVESSAQSRIGKTYLTAYYNDVYGFVKYDYTNIDGSRININLVEFRGK